MCVCVFVCVSYTHEPFSAAGSHTRWKMLSSCRPRKDETDMTIQDSQFEFRGVVVKLSTFRKLVEERGGLDECSVTNQWASVVRSPLGRVLNYQTMDHRGKVSVT